MSLRINDEAPNFTAETTQGRINFHEWIGDGWAILFSHPKDFTPVCTTELGYMAGLQPEFAKRNCKILGLSVDPVGSHSKWTTDIEETQGHKVNYPLIGDPELKIAKLYDMLPADAGNTSEGRTPALNATVRTVFVVGPDKKIKLMLSYPMSTGRNFDEVLRVLDSIQLTAKHQVATPVNWKQGQDVIILTSVSDEDAKKKYPQGWKAPRPYLRIVSQPKEERRGATGNSHKKAQKTQDIGIKHFCVFCAFLWLFPNCFDNSLKHLGCQFRIDRQGKAFFGGRFAGRQLDRLVAQFFEAGLELQGNRIVDFASNLLFSQVSHQFITPGAPDNELIVDMPRMTHLVGKCNRL